MAWQGRQNGFFGIVATSGHIYTKHGGLGYAPPRSCKGQGQRRAPDQPSRPWPCPSHCTEGGTVPRAGPLVWSAGPWRLTQQALTLQPAHPLPQSHPAFRLPWGVSGTPPAVLEGRQSLSLSGGRAGHTSAVARMGAGGVLLSLPSLLPCFSPPTKQQVGNKAAFLMQSNTPSPPGPVGPPRQGTGRGLLLRRHAGGPGWCLPTHSFS